MVVLLVLQRLDFGNATLVGLPAYQLSRLQSVLNAAARLVFSRSKHDHVTPLLQELQWLTIEPRIEIKLSVLVFRCLNARPSPVIYNARRALEYIQKVFWGHRIEEGL